MNGVAEKVGEWLREEGEPQTNKGRVCTDLGWKDIFETSMLSYCIPQDPTDSPQSQGREQQTTVEDAKSGDLTYLTKGDIVFQRRSMPSRTLC